MTHQPEQPNAGQQLAQRLMKLLTSGDYMPVHEANSLPTDYLNELLRNPDLMAKAVAQASNFNFGGVTGPEKIASAAIKFGGKTYTGQTHSAAFSKAEDTLKPLLEPHEWSAISRAFRPEDEGFITSTGRFVGRSEASGIADAAKQVNKESSDYAPGSLTSESIKALLAILGGAGASYLPAPGTQQ
jgi:hypothetical protein